MAELREVFDMVTKQMEPDQDAWRDQERRQRRTARNRKLGAIALVAALVIGVVTFAVVSKPHLGSAPATRPPAGPGGHAPTFGAQLISLDGSVSRTLPGTFADDQSLQLSPDGAELLSVSSSGVVTTIGVDGTNERTLTSGQSQNRGDAEGHASWSPDGTKIAYDWSGDIYVMNADGSSKHRLTQDVGGFGNYYPAWSPDGSTIAYWHGSSGPQGDGGPLNAEIDTIPVDGGSPARLTHDGVPSIEPAWSPDGTKIVYRRSGNQDLVVMDADGRNAHRITAGALNPWAPTWSPDGSKIAFLDCCTATGSPPLLQVQVLDVNSGQVRTIGVDAATDLNGPEWVGNSTLLINRYD